MRTTTSFAFNMLLVIPVAILFAMPGEAKQPSPASMLLTSAPVVAAAPVAKAAPQGFDLFLDTSVAQLSIELPTSILDF